jgi:hypothetical protein
MITFELLDALQRRYAPASEQKCVVCGAPLQFSHGDHNGERWNCSSDDASPVRSTRPFRERLDHYENSRWWDRGQTDAHVAELVRAYRELACTPGERYFLTAAGMPEYEVSKAEYVKAERRAGFHNTLGFPDEPATGSFSNVAVCGRMEFVPAAQTEPARRPHYVSLGVTDEQVARGEDSGRYDFPNLGSPGPDHDNIREW